MKTKLLGLFIMMLCVCNTSIVDAVESCSYQTTKRAVKINGSPNLPSACKLSTCRSEGAATAQIYKCGGNPTCIIGAFYVEIWKAESGAWSGLPACPSWTNTSTWQ